MNEISFEALEEKIKEKESFLDIKKAYVFACNALKNAKNEVGESYISHDLHVLESLLDYSVDDVTLEAAILHNVLYNDTITHDLLCSEFSEEIATIVENLNKIDKLELPDNNESSILYLRKILVGLVEDGRVLIIKLVDRLQTLRFVKDKDSDKKKILAEETKNVLVPIAHRLGINKVKSELENLCLFIEKPDVYNDILEKLNASEEDLRESLNDMQDAISDLIEDAGIKFEIKGRVKSVYSIYNKLTTGRSWNDIYDILALRVFVEKETECYQVVGLIHSRFRPVPNRFKDYISTPKENMYQSLHTTVFGPGGKMFEIQIRTYEMDEVAEKGVASHWSYKEHGIKKNQNIMEQKLEMFRNIIEANASEDDANFTNIVNNDIFADLIYVLTPKGDVVELPKGSTPIDFAYRIHSRVGDTLVSAIVNNQIVPLNYELQNDDVVNIKTNANSTPAKDWINICKTPQAKNKIKAYFSKKDKEEYIKIGREILEKEIRKRKLSISETLNGENTEKILKELKLKDLDDIYLGIGSLRYTAGYIINLITTIDEEEHPTEFLIERKKNTPKINYNSDVLVDGVSNIMVHMARCCMPIKGDDVVGFITKGQGITIHKKTCPNIDLSSDRIINVVWNMNNSNFYYTNIYVYVKDNKDLLAVIITEIDKKEGIVKSFNTKNYDNYLVYELNIRVSDKNMLNDIIKSVNKLSDVIDVKTSL